MPKQALFAEQMLAIDKAHIWHPYASTVDAPPIYPVVSAHGERLTLADGRELLDGMSSWWSVIHGYNNPVLNNAAKAQIDQMSHVMFGGITHPPAVKLAKLLVDITPEPLDRVFFSDSGSVAVEVAIKMALQYWYSIGKPEKHQLLTVKNITVSKINPVESQVICVLKLKLVFIYIEFFKAISSCGRIY